jgi:hypothetical protein
MNTNYYKGESKTPMVSSLTTEAIRGFENLKPSSNYNIYTMPDFPEPLELVMGMNATRITLKHGGYK